MEQNIIVVVCVLALEIHGCKFVLLKRLKFLGVQMFGMFEILGHTDVQILAAKLYLDHVACNAGGKENFLKYQYDVILGRTLKHSPPTM